MLEVCLPDKIKQQLDYDNIKIEPTVFLEDKLREEVWDILFSVKLDGLAAYVYMLCTLKRLPTKVTDQLIMRSIVHYKNWYLDLYGGKVPTIMPFIFCLGEDD